MAQTHYLKTWTDMFWEIKYGNKTFDVREIRDRNFQVGDNLIFEEYDPIREEYMHGVIGSKVTYILTGEKWGIKDGYCVMGLKLEWYYDRPSDKTEWFR